MRRVPPWTIIHLGSQSSSPWHGKCLLFDETLYCCWRLDDVEQPSPANEPSPRHSDAFRIDRSINRFEIVCNLSDFSRPSDTTRSIEVSSCLKITTAAFLAIFLSVLVGSVATAKSFLCLNKEVSIILVLS